MKRWIVPGVWVLGCSGLLSGGVWLVSDRPAPDTPLTPVLVELFTSQGCSSCPPADEFLIRLDEQQPVAGALVIPFSEHVEYWNGRGWRDPFSAPTFTRRQQEYRDALAAGALYTPQMVVDGRMEFVGSQREIAELAIARAAATPKAEMALVMTGGGRSHVTVEVTISGVPRLGALGEADLWLACRDRRRTGDGCQPRRECPPPAPARRRCQAIAANRDASPSRSGTLRGASPCCARTRVVHHELTSRGVSPGTEESAGTRGDPGTA